MTDLATLQTRLTEAETALHRLVTLKIAVDVNTGSRSVRYAYDAGSIRELRSYIADLKAQIAAVSGTSVGRRAIGMTF